MLVLWVVSFLLTTPGQNVPGGDKEGRAAASRETVR